VDCLKWSINNENVIKDVISKFEVDLVLPGSQLKELALKVTELHRLTICLTKDYNKSKLLLISNLIIEELSKMASEDQVLNKLIIQLKTTAKVNYQGMKSNLTIRIIEFLDIRGTKEGDGDIEEMYNIFEKKHNERNVGSNKRNDEETDYLKGVYKKARTSDVNETDQFDNENEYFWYYNEYLYKNSDEDLSTIYATESKMRYPVIAEMYRAYYCQQQHIKEFKENVITGLSAGKLEKILFVLSNRK